MQGERPPDVVVRFTWAEAMAVWVCCSFASRPERQAEAITEAALKTRDAMTAAVRGAAAAA